MLTLTSGSRKYAQTVVNAAVAAQKKAVLPFRSSSVGLIKYLKWNNHDQLRSVHPLVT